ncbi:MAG TPA: hypothetical protein VGS03_09510 [Candidatus Polarisedimenticolia bacterium]|jgi:hypothetical protein|nr:hypothetical protein [Candidatus Polarisedimenticolia bacterium]
MQAELFGQTCIDMLADGRERIMKTKALVVLALSLGLVAAAYAAPAAPAKTGTTVGEFAIRVATAMGTEEPNASKAAEAIRSRGVDLSVDLSATLTEGTVARIMTDLGMKVSAPANPNTPVSDAKAGYLAGVIGANAVTSGISLETGLPTQCLSSVDRGTCVECCKVATGCGKPPAPFDCNVCAKFCHNNVPPGPSDQEPAP